MNSRDEAGVPPRTYTFTLEDTISGTLNTRIPTDPAKHYDVYTSTTAGDPPAPSASTLTLFQPLGAGRRAAAAAKARAELLAPAGLVRGISPNDFRGAFAQRPQRGVARHPGG